MANPQIRIIDLPQDTDLSTSYSTDFIPVESSAEGGRKVTIYDFFNTAGTLLFYSKVAGGGTNRAIATFNSAASGLYDNPNATIDSSGNVTALSFKATSTARFKTNIQEIIGATELVKQLNGVTFDWTIEPMVSTKPHDIGLIAEEVAKIVPSAVGVDKDGIPCAVDYSKLVAILINAIKELNARVEALERKT